MPFDFRDGTVPYAIPSKNTHNVQQKTGEGICLIL